ncbi:MAG: 4Fe-4S dicluster domain-containing protein [Deltaproteobacteria bacterium]|nr:4Fe-4S dicluster domain-containing protein [Deltaproteobacteria bacterium]
MGHLAGKEEILKQLRERLHHNPWGLPEHPYVYEILSILFNDKEAEVGTKFPFGIVTIEELEKATGIVKGDLEGILEGMMKKGLVVNSVKDNQVRYFLSPGLVGFFEFTFMRTNESLPMKRLAELMYSYRNTPEMVQELWLSKTNRGKAFIYRGVLPQVRSEVLRFDEAAEHIKMAGRGGLTKCYCRHETWHLGKNCSAPIDDICMSLGVASDFLIEQGFARKASVEELLTALKRAEDFGLVHVGDNVQDQTTFICNCCGCCCAFLEGINKHQKRALATTNYIARLKQEGCNGCEICADHCQIKAIKMEGDYPVVDVESCIGCGVCANFCPTEAMKMGEREKRVIPPKTYKELMVRLMQEKGRM